MHRRVLLDLLQRHRPADADEARALAELGSFVRAHRACFERSFAPGHVTGSAWIVSDDRSEVVLVHHAKLGRWLQPGGHADGDGDVARVALREAREETSLGSLRLLSAEIFDVDVHEIPASGAEPAHLHYDVRFLFAADRHEPPAASRESSAVEWVGLRRAETLAGERSIARMIEKTWAGAAARGGAPESAREERSR